jgi:hypothetical protein
MLRMRSVVQAGLLACSIATSPAAAQVAAGDSAGPPPATGTQPPAEVSRFVERFQAANTTGDGRLTLAQAQAGSLSMIARHFDAIDTQHKGYVTLEDIRAYRQQMRAMRQGGNGAAN